MPVSASDCGFLESVIKKNLAVFQEVNQALFLVLNNSLFAHFPCKFSVSILERQTLYFEAIERKTVVCTESTHLNILSEEGSISEAYLPVTNVLSLVSIRGEV